MEYITAVLIGFKIDLIVWKRVELFEPEDIHIPFKIDLIVWKHRESVTLERGDVMCLK